MGEAGLPAWKGFVGFEIGGWLQRVLEGELFTSVAFLMWLFVKWVLQAMYQVSWISEHVVKSDVLSGYLCWKRSSFVLRHLDCQGKTQHGVLWHG